MKYSVEVDESKCIGCGSCSVLGPEIFGFDGDKNISYVKDDADLTNIDLLIKCAESCPVFAIVVKDDSGKILNRME